MDTASLASARTRAADYLLRARNTDGSWGYLPGQRGAGEPTLLAVGAGLPAPIEWLETAELDYAWLLLPAVLSGVPGAEALVASTVDRILGAQGVLWHDVPREINDNDFTIPGWSWVDGTTAWVEPTSYALLSLNRAGKKDDPRAAEGVRMLRDRQCSDGGWNYGNRRVKGADLESEIAPTAWAVMALPAGPEVERAWPRLAEARQLRSSLTLSLSTLAFAAHGADPGDLPELLVQHQQPDGSYSGRADWTALGLAAMRAVEEGVHAFVARP